MQTPNNKTVIALDVGERRIGVALASMTARLAGPLQTLTRSESSAADIKGLVVAHGAAALVIGLPRGLDGQHTAQTQVVEEFGKSVEQTINIPVYWQDEAVTSRQAEEELRARGKPYQKGDIDALSATYILEDFLRDHPEVA